MDTKEVVQGKLDWNGRPAVRGKHGGLFASMIVIAQFGLHVCATVALSVNLVTYLTSVMHFTIPEASNTVTNFSGTGFILSIPAAYLAEAFIGRYRTILISITIEILGFLLLTVQARSPALKPPPCKTFDPTSHCEKVKGSHAAMLYTSLYLIAFGMAGIKAGAPAHGADQFDEKHAAEAEKMTSFFSWLLLSASVGTVISLVFIVWLETDVGWYQGFGVSGLISFISMAVFLSGTPAYRIHVIQETNPFTDILKVLVASFRNRKLPYPENSTDLYEIGANEVAFERLPHRDFLRVLDKAAIKRTTSSQSVGRKPNVLNSWELCRVTEVEKTKIMVGMIPIFGSTILMSTCLAQLQTFSVQQGVTMDTRITKSIHIPPATLPAIPFAFMIVIVSVYDRVFVPFARRITGLPTGITHFQRIGAGLMMSIVSMAIAAIVEVKRKGVAESHGMLDAIPVAQPLSISIFWLSFQYFVFGIADMLAWVGLLEFFYSEAPKALKSMSTCFFWCSFGLGYFLSSVMVQLVDHATKGIKNSRGWLAGNNLNRNHLDLFYWLLAGLSFLNFLNYLYWARWYKYSHPNVKVAKEILESDL